ncbi:transcriptional regulator [uncultured Arcticibacterium sp.]|uniref:GntR family transcriptional regulator n=1 Tax=uncultured Arcticibacterium sp. TaxID=2173042 RepID=UPI0030F4BFE8
MKEHPLIQLISIDGYSATPKYLQLANSILAAISKSAMEKDETLPSINELSYGCDISRDTAEKGYKYLKKMGILDSVPGKSYFIKSTTYHPQPNILLLANKLNAHKKIIYDSLVASLDETVFIDFYVYNNDYNYFKKLLKNNNQNYTHYVVIPHFTEGSERIHEFINSEIPSEKLIVVDKPIQGIKGEYGAVCQNFKADIFNAMEQARDALAKYQKIKIIFPQDAHHPKEILAGLSRFCEQYSFELEAISGLLEEEIEKGVAYISITESDLISLVEKAIASPFKVGTDVGVISYNETPLKKVILNGITTISTDFQMMGQKTAQLIQNNTKEHIEVPFYLTLRASL